jgi:hypothetical protein
MAVPNNNSSDLLSPAMADLLNLATAALSNSKATTPLSSHNPYVQPLPRQLRSSITNVKAMIR